MAVGVKLPHLGLSCPDGCFLGCSDLHLLDMLTPTERKRQGYIHELIVTEENYVNDLQLVTEVTAGVGAGGVGGPRQRVGRGGPLLRRPVS